MIDKKFRFELEEYLLKNQIVNLHPELTKYLVDDYLKGDYSKSKIEKEVNNFLKK